eukprot:4711282-Amphidinium_carterae.1
MPVRYGALVMFFIRWMAASAAPLDWCSPTPLSRHISSMSGMRIRRSAFSLSMAGSPSLCKTILR